MKNLAELLASLRERHAGETVDGDAPLEWCLNCEASLAGAELYERFRVCPSCEFHYTVGAWERIEQLVDAGSFAETHRNLISIDPLSFERRSTSERRGAGGQEGWRRRIFAEQRRTGLT